MVKISTQNYWKNADQLQNFIDEHLEKDETEYLTLTEIFNCYTESDYYYKNKKILKRDFKTDLEKKLGKCRDDRPNFNGIAITQRSVFLGYKMITNDNENII